MVELVIVRHVEENVALGRMKSSTSICAVDAIIVQENPLLGTVAVNMLDRERRLFVSVIWLCCQTGLREVTLAVWKMEVPAYWVPRQNKNRSQYGAPTTTKSHYHYIQIYTNLAKIQFIIEIEARNYKIL